MLEHEFKKIHIVKFPQTFVTYQFLRNYFCHRYILYRSLYGIGIPDQSVTFGLGSIGLLRTCLKLDKDVILDKV